MRFAILGGALGAALFWVTQFTASAAGASLQRSAQSSSTAQSSSGELNQGSSASGEQTVAGCIVQENAGYVLKTASGNYPLNSDRDLSPYVGKRVSIEEHWQATGTTTPPISPASDSTSAPPPPSQPSAAEQSSAPLAFEGDLHVHLSARVIGDCDSHKP